MNLKISPRKAADTIPYPELWQRWLAKAREQKPRLHLGVFAGKLNQNRKPK